METQLAGDSLIIIPGRGEAGTVGELLVQRLFFGQAFAERLAASHRIRIAKSGGWPSLASAVGPGQRMVLQGGIEEDFGVLGWYPGGPWEAACPLYEDDHVLVVDKPPGIIVYPGGPEDIDTLAHRVAEYYWQNGLHRKVRHVHRLDRETTGALLYAKHEYSARTFDALLAQRQVSRRYIALLAGCLDPPQGTVRAPIGRDRHVAGRYRVSANGKPAVTHYRTLAVARGDKQAFSLVECTLSTGRTHQIRVHMAHLGCPVLGDALYGPSGPAGAGGGAPFVWQDGHALHAYRLSFYHPYMARQVDVLAPLPAAFASAMRVLGMPPVSLPAGWDSGAPSGS